VSDPVRHLRRVLANHTSCDADDERQFVDDLKDVTCKACVESYRHRDNQWIDELAERARRRRDPGDGGGSQGEPP
jgi:hypothetical protein